MDEGRLAHAHISIGELATRDGLAISRRESRFPRGRDPARESVSFGGVRHRRVSPAGRPRAKLEVARTDDGLGYPSERARSPRVRPHCWQEVAGRAPVGTRRGRKGGHARRRRRALAHRRARQGGPAHQVRVPALPGQGQQRRWDQGRRQHLQAGRHLQGRQVAARHGRAAGRPVQRQRPEARPRSAHRPRRPPPPWSSATAKSWWTPPAPTTPSSARATRTPSPCSRRRRSTWRSSCRRSPARRTPSRRPRDHLR